MAWGIMLLSLGCTLALVAGGVLGVTDLSLRMYDERMDVRGGTGGEALTHTEVDILEVFVTDERTVDSFDFQIELAGDHSPDAVYTLRLLLDGQYDAWLEFRDGDNWTGSDSRGVDWAPSGADHFPEKVIWHVPITTVDVTRDVRVIEAKAEILTEDSKTFSDTCSWDLTDIDKGLMTIEVTYKLLDGDTIKREVTLGLGGEAAAGYRFSVDMDGDQYIDEGEIDFWLEELEMAVNGSDMSMKFNQHTARKLEMTAHFEPGPLCSDGSIRFDSILELTYPSTTAREIYYAWESELGGHFGIPYYRANDRSFLRITTPEIRDDEVYRFGQWDLTPVTEQFYRNNYTLFHMNGTQLRAHWNTTMRDSMGFTVFAEDKPAEQDDDPCNILNEIILVPAAFIALTGWRGWDRRRRAGPGGGLSPPYAP